MMTPEELLALEMVINYLENEADDHANFVASGGDATKHIYTHVKILDDYLTGLKSTGNYMVEAA